MLRRLIINADDLGMNVQRSHGILQCVEFGVVSSVSIIPNCSDSDTAAKHAKERAVPAGLHINLTEEYPLSKQDQIASLVEVSGQFFNRERLIELLDEGAIKREHLERELRAQIEWMFDTYGPPTHVDSHHHVHIHPVIVQALLPLFERYGIRYVRIPDESPLPPFGYEVLEAQLTYVANLGAQARAARETYASVGVGSTDHFRGMTLAGNASLKNLRHVLSKLPEGTTELMVHPGSQTTYGTAFDLDPQRQTELRMLLDETIPALIAERKIQLCSYADM